MKTCLELASELIACRSVTPEDGGCQNLIADYLGAVGFEATSLRFEDVDNIWLTHGVGKPLFVFAGHTDVVPTGPLEDWHSDPFTAEIRNGYLYGRGAADMKGNIAAMITSAWDFVSENPDHAGTIAFLLTSDEEGPAVNGTCKVIDYLNDNDINIDWCIVGEPTSNRQLGDNIQIGRRGSLGATLIIKGVQGHVAHPKNADNPIHRAAAFINEISTMKWDSAKGDSQFPETTLQISNIHAGTGAENVIPGILEMKFNLRFSDQTTPEEIKRRTTNLLKKYQLNHDIEWQLSGRPFLSKAGKLTDVTLKAIKELYRTDAVCSTGGGISDARFIVPTGAEVIELGVLRKTIHRVNECVKISDLEQLSVLYQTILERLLGNKNGTTD